MWTEAHVGNPSLLAQDRRGYTNRLTVGCGSLHAAVSKGTHDHRSTGYAGGTPTQDPTESTTGSTLGVKNHEQGKMGSHTCDLANQLDFTMLFSAHTQMSSLVPALL